MNKTQIYMERTRQMAKLQENETLLREGKINDARLLWTIQQRVNNARRRLFQLNEKITREERRYELVKLSANAIIQGGEGEISVGEVAVLSVELADAILNKMEEKGGEL